MRRSGVRAPPGAEGFFFNLFISIETFPSQYEHGKERFEHFLTLFRRSIPKNGFLYFPRAHCLKTDRINSVGIGKEGVNRISCGM